MKKSPVIKRSIVIAKQKTSVSLEDCFWSGLREIAKGKEMTLSELAGEIDANRKHGNLSSAIRVYVFNHFADEAAWRRSAGGAPEAVAVRDAQEAA